MKKTIALLSLVVCSVAAHAQFTSITLGPTNSYQCTSQPGLYFDQQDNILASCGKGLDLNTAETALAVFTPSTVTAVTTAQTLASLALGANVQNIVGRTLKVCGFGVYTSPGTTAPTLTIQVTEGGITPVAITTAALSTTASTSLPFQFCYRITTASKGATGTLEAHGYLNANISANTAAAAVATYLDTNTAVSSAVNLTAANTLAIQVVASSALTSVSLRQASIEVVN